jgi:hypothetical protein
MAKVQAKKKTAGKIEELSDEGVQRKVENTLVTLFKLQQHDSQIDRIQMIRGELPLEVQDLEDEIVGLETRVENHKEEIQALEKSIQEKK